MFIPLAGKLKLKHCLIAVAVISVYSVSAGYKEAYMERERASKPESQDQTPVVQDFRDTNVTSREGLEARPSTVPGAAFGLFTTKALKKGDFLGFYCGRKVPVENYAEMTEDESRYSGKVTERMIVVADTINYPERDKMAFLNEAPYPGRGPNVAGLNYNVTHKGQKFSSIAFYVLRGVKADGELFVYYGSGYDVVRKKEGYSQPYRYPATRMKNIEDPQSVLETIPSNCFAEADG